MCLKGSYGREWGLVTGPAALCSTLQHLQRGRLKHASDTKDRTDGHHLRADLTNCVILQPAKYDR